MNSLMEWLLIPEALFLNWHIPKRRTLIVIAAAAFYAMRIWSYVYFVPNIFEFGALPPDGPFSAEVVERFRMWVNLNWLRIAIQDVLTYLLFLLAAFVPASATGTSGNSPVRGQWKRKPRAHKWPGPSRGGGWSQDHQEEPRNGTQKG